MFDVERILAALGEKLCFGGKVVHKLGMKNKLLVRKNLYQQWIDDRKGLRSHGMQRLKCRKNKH